MKRLIYGVAAKMSAICCDKCGGYTALIAPKTGTAHPTLCICWRCNKIWEYGKGELK
jgi:hypothetical protein